MSNPPRAGMAPPLPRAWLDTIASAIRVLFGLIFIAWSWVSTVIIVGAWLRPLLPGTTIPGAPDWFLVAFLFAFLVSLVEFVSSDRWPVIYWIVLLFLDTSLTTRQTHVGLLIIVQAQLPAEAAIAPLGHAAIWLASIIGGILAAKFRRSDPIWKEVSHAEHSRRYALGTHNFCDRFRGDACIRTAAVFAEPIHKLNCGLLAVLQPVCGAPSKEPQRCHL